VPAFVLNIILALILIGTIFGMIDAISDYRTHIADLTLFGRAFVISGLIATPILWIGLATMTLSSFARTESLHIDTARLARTKRDLFRGNSVQYDVDRIKGFQCRRDPQGLRQSQLVMLSNAAGIDEVELCEGASEAEKEWLASVLNVLLARVKSGI
jgi:hypothetical protein